MQKNKVVIRGVFKNTSIILKGGKEPIKSCDVQVEINNYVRLSSKKNEIKMNRFILACIQGRYNPDTQKAISLKNLDRTKFIHGTDEKGREYYYVAVPYMNRPDGNGQRFINLFLDEDNMAILDSLNLDVVWEEKVVRSDEFNSEVDND